MNSRTLCSSLALFAFAPALLAQTISVDGTVTAVNADTNAAWLAFVGGTPYYPYTGVSSGTGAATAINGFASLTGVTPADLTYSFDNLDLTAYSGGGPGASVETYTPGSGSDFTFFLNGQPLATGEVISFVVTTGFDTGLATAVGSLHLSSPGTDPAFFNEVSALTGGANLVSFSAPNLFFDLAPSLAQGVFHSAGTFSVTPVPEPAGCAALAGLAAVGCAFIRRRRRA